MAGGGGNNTQQQSAEIAAQQRSLADQLEALQRASLQQELNVYSSQNEVLNRRRDTEALVASQMAQLLSSGQQASNIYQGALSQLQGVQERVVGTNAQRTQSYVNYANNYLSQMQAALPELQAQLSQAQVAQTGALSRYQDVSERARARAAQEYGNIRQVAPYGYRPAQRTTVRNL